MSRYKTRWEVRCEYRHQCPYLDGMSTKWCLDEYRRSCERESEHWRIREQQQQELRESFNIIKQLERENEELKARLKALHQKQFKKNVKTHNKVNNAPVHGSGIPSDESNNAKKRGAPTGHPGWFRKKPQKIDIHKNVPPPQKCPLCNSADLSATNEKSTHVQEDIVLTPRTVVTEFIHEMAYCNCCKQLVIKTEENELANAHIGPVTKAAAVFLRYGLNIPYRKVQKLFEVFFGMRFVPASAMAFDRLTAKRGDALYEDIREKIRVASIIHADETHWREDGENRYLWYAGNQHLAFFHIDKHRSSDVATSILGNSFDGLLITDRYAAYNAVNAKDRQTCLAHIITATKEIKEELLLRNTIHQDHTVIAFCDSLSELMKKTCKIAHEYKSNTLTQTNIETIKKNLFTQLDTICRDTLTVKKAENLRAAIMDKQKQYYQLFTFLKYPGAPPTNNHAEQTLRGPVIFRKISFGTRSTYGSYSFCVNLSLMHTAIRQGKNPLDFFLALLCLHSADAHTLLYKKIKPG